MNKNNWKTDFHISDEVLKDLARISVKFLNFKSNGFIDGLESEEEIGNKELVNEKIKGMTKRFDDEAKYVWSVANRLIHFEHLLEEIDYAFHFLSNSKIPKWGNEPCNHFVYCQRTVDFYVTAVKDRSLQLISCVFCLQMDKDKITERILKEKVIHKDVVDCFKDMRDAMSEFQNRKNVFLHRESIPSLMISKNDIPSKDEFDRRMQQLREEWDNCLPSIILLMDCLVHFYKHFKSHFTSSKPAN